MIPQDYADLLTQDLEADMKVDDVCWSCGGLAIVYYDHSYHGFRGKCPDCNTNWPLS